MSTTEDRLEQVEMLVEAAKDLLEDFQKKGLETKPVKDYVSFLRSKRRALLRRRLPR